MAPKISGRSIGAVDGCAARRTHRRTLSARCALRSSKAGARDGAKKGLAQQSGLCGIVRGAGRKSVPESLGTKESSRSSTASLEQTASIVKDKNEWRSAAAK